MDLNWETLRLYDHGGKVKNSSICPECHGMDDEMCDCQTCWGAGKIWLTKNGIYSLGFEPNYTQILNGYFKVELLSPLRELLNNLLP